LIRTINLENKALKIFHQNPHLIEEDNLSLSDISPEELQRKLESSTPSRKQSLIQQVLGCPRASMSWMTSSDCNVQPEFFEGGARS